MKSRTREETIDCVLKLDTIRDVCALILYPALVELAVNLDFSFFPSVSKSVAVEGRSFSFAVAPLSLVNRLSCS